MNLNNICAALCPFTNEWLSWSSSDSEIIRSDGLRFWIREGGYGNEGKIAIHFSRPRGRNGSTPTLWMMSPGTDKIADPRICVSASKSDEQIAKDIVRRLMPESLRVFAMAKVAIEQENNYIDSKTQAIIDLAKVVGCEPGRHYQTKEMTGEVDPYIGAGVTSFKEKGYGKFKVSSANSISLELHSMNYEMALKVAAALKEVLSN